ncbi:hypothetical protein [Candidatus Ichthyocystis hellenicum]|uniref:hypothetical protein n=1 Tax=Candidatus Ichthyocystis hellenicum TaxID=1561003 RepID=UPI000B82228B|nr:hypothetical protein [Candidatus Ichthyocystis hellenicum]
MIISRSSCFDCTEVDSMELQNDILVDHSSTEEDIVPLDQEAGGGGSYNGSLLSPYLENLWLL